MNAITKTQEAQMAAIAAAATTLAQESPSGGAFLKLNKVGYWVYGEDLLDIEEDSQWAINPASFAMGFIAWPAGTKLGAPLGEKMASIYAAPVVESSLPEVESKWQRQVAMQLVCLNGEDEGEQVNYQASTMGGCKAFGALLASVMKYLQGGKAGKKTVPVVELSSTSYDNKDGIEVFNPEFKIVKWIENTGFAAPVEEEEEEQEEEQEQEKPPSRKRSSKKKAAPVETVVEDEDEEEAEPEEEEKPTRRRRRTRK